jgi:hypothetical protein
MGSGALPGALPPVSVVYWPTFDLFWWLVLVGVVILIDLMVRY